MENVSALRLRDRLYAGPFLGYILKLCVSIARLPIRLKQIYENLDHVRTQLDALQSSNAAATQAKQEMLQAVETLKEMNHKIHVQNDSFRAEMREKISRTLEGFSDLENKVSRFQAGATPQAPGTAPAAPAEEIGSAFYAAFERRFRSLQTAIDEHFSSYVPFLQSIRKAGELQVAVDLGCGRGEFLKVLKTEGFQAIGVDKNTATNRSGQSEGLTVVDADALDYLKESRSGSFNVISSFHFIEHVEPGYLLRLIQEAFRCLQPGGLLILETPNPENLMVGACNFYNDPTHRRPIPPSALAFMTDYFGFELLECLRFHSDLPPYEGEDKHLQRIASYFSAGQDYALVVKKPYETRAV